jgi:esterase
MRVLIALVLTTLLASCAAPDAGPSAPERVKTLRIDGYNMAYIERGSGPTLILVHGALSDFRSFEPQMGPLSARYRVIAISLRHYYPERWDGVGSDFSISQHAEDVAGFIRALDTGPVHLLGHSRGGNVVLHVAKNHAGLLRTLILADASGLEGLLPKSPAGTTAGGGSEMRVAVREKFKSGEIETGLETYIDFAAGPGGWKAMPERTKQMFRDNAWTVLADTDRPTTSCAEGALITVPTLFVNGQRSPSRYPAMAQLFQSCLKDQERIVIPNASHGMFTDNPDATNSAIISFLDKH